MATTHWPTFCVLLVPLGLLNIGLIFSVLKIGSVVSDLFKGTAAAGGGFAGNRCRRVQRSFQVMSTL